MKNKKKSARPEAVQSDIQGKKSSLKNQGNCRCKDISEKSYPELFKVMVKDLTFWKKAK
jgi:hypothetical protein